MATEVVKMVNKANDNEIKETSWFARQAREKHMTLDEFETFIKEFKLFMNNAEYTKLEIDADIQLVKSFYLLAIENNQLIYNHVKT